MASSAEVIATRFREFSADCSREGLPLYARLSAVSAETPELVAMLTRAQPGQARPVLVLAAVHRVLFDHPDAPLAAFYGSLGGGWAVGDDDPGPAFLAFCRDHHDELVALVERRATQTNEVNRSVAVAAGLRATTRDLADVPVALVELGPSAGLNLRADTYAIELDDGTLHQVPASAVRLATRLVGPGRPDLDSAPPSVVARTGLDLRPIDVLRDHDELRWLEACLWPEQSARISRFRAAVEAARSDPPVLVAGDLLDDLPALLDGLPTGAHTLVFHSWVVTYVDRERRPQLVEILARAAERRPVSWLSIEGVGVMPGHDVGVSPDGSTTAMVLTTFRGDDGQQRSLGTCHPHLTWLAWEASGAR